MFKKSTKKFNNQHEIESIEPLFNDPKWITYWLEKPKSFGYVWVQLFDKIFKEAKRIYPLDLNDKKILIVGCGPGAEAEWLFKHGAKIFCTDINKNFLKLAKKRLGKKSEGYDIADAENLKFKDNSFDIVYLCGVLHHIPDYKKALTEFKRVAKEGVIIINEPRNPPLLEYLMRVVNWNTEYGNLETHRFKSSDLVDTLSSGGWNIRTSFKWCYFPRMLNFLRNSKIFSKLWMGFMNFLNIFLPTFGHQINIVAWKK